MTQVATTTPETPTATAPAIRGKIVQGGKTWFWGTGRRKKSVARVRFTVGTGKFIVNKREVDAFFQEAKDRAAVRAPMTTANVAAEYDIFADCKGGGYSGQAGAIVQAIARALVMLDPANRPAQKAGGFLTRDSRMKERKKYGQRGARRRFQFSKR